MSDFVHDAPAPRVVFGAGRLESLPHEVARLGPARLLVITTPGQEELGDRVARLLGRACAGSYARARQHVPVATVEDAAGVAERSRADGYVAVGGGSTVGLAKALALRSGLPGIAVPTTYAGSEMTPVWGLSEGGVKRTGRDPRVLPRLVVYDPELTLGLPAATSAASGLNALAHAVEALYAPDTTPLVAAMAERGVRDLAVALPVVAAHPRDLGARGRALQGAWLCGACLAATTMGLHHRLCHVLGGLLDLPHAETHAVLLPHVAAFNLPASPVARASLARALGTADPVAAIAALAASVDAPRSLAGLGVAEGDLTRVVEAVLDRPPANPRAVTGEAVAAVLRAAWSGEPLPPPGPA